MTVVRRIHRRPLSGFVDFLWLAVRWGTAGHQRAPTGLWGSGALALAEQLPHSAVPAAGFQIIERFLFERLHKSRDSHPAVQYAIDTIGDTDGAASVASNTLASGKFFSIRATRGS
jgi:hypothetical protein